jgi:uncharacterized phage-associated protein
MKKDKRKLMEETTEAWVMESPQTRTIFCVIGDKETNTTSCGVHGREDLIVEAIANEMLNDRDIADVVMTSVKVYHAVLEEEKEEKEKVKKETTKIYS